MIKLGQSVKDSITGLKGIAVGRCVYLNGCISIEVQATTLHDGKVLDTVWFDEQRLTDSSAAKAGGPQSRPPGLSRPTGGGRYE